MTRRDHGLLRRRFAHPRLGGKETEVDRRFEHGRDIMVITPLSPVGLNTLLPAPAPEGPAPTRLHDIVVTVQRDGTLLLNSERVALASLPGRLAQIFQARGDTVIFLRGDSELEYGRVAEVIDAAKGAGLQRVALMTR